MRQPCLPPCENVQLLSSRIYGSCSQFFESREHEGRLGQDEQSHLGLGSRQTVAMHAPEIAMFLGRENRIGDSIPKGVKSRSAGPDPLTEPPQGIVGLQVAVPLAGREAAFDKLVQDDFEHEIGRVGQRAHPQISFLQEGSIQSIDICQNTGRLLSFAIPTIFPRKLDVLCKGGKAHRKTGMN